MPLINQLLLKGHPKMRFLECEDIMEDSLLEPRPTHSLEWAWKHSPSQDQWWELLGSLGQCFYSQYSDPRACQSSLLGCLSIEWPGQWYCECEWVWWTILPTLGLHYHNGSGGRGVGLWWRPSGPGCARSDWVWLPGASYFGYIDYQPNHKCD